MAILSFSLTVPQLLAGTKTQTRRFWSPRQIALWQGFWDRHLLAHQAYDRNPRNGGKEIGTIILTARPFLQPLADMTCRDLREEGGMCETVPDFCRLVQKKPEDIACVLFFILADPNGDGLPDICKVACRKREIGDCDYEGSKWCVRK